MPVEYLAPQYLGYLPYVGVIVVLGILALCWSKTRVWLPFTIPTLLLKGLTLLRRIGLESKALSRCL
jgi:hypothetical protein